MAAAPGNKQELIQLLKNSIELIEKDEFDATTVYGALGALHTFATQHVGLPSVAIVQKVPPARPCYHASPDSPEDVIASGWLEEMTPAKTFNSSSTSSSSPQPIVWRQVLLLLAQKEQEEPCLWVTREILDVSETGEPDLETLHRVPMRKLASSEYVNYYGDFRIALNIKRRSQDLIFRSESESSAQAWVEALQKAKSQGRALAKKEEAAAAPSVELEMDESTGEILNVNALAMDNEESEEVQRMAPEQEGGTKDLHDRLQEAEDLRKIRQEQEEAQQRAHNGDPSAPFDEGKQEEASVSAAIRNTDDERRRREYELEQQKKAAAEQRRKGLAKQRKLAQEEQKKKDAEAKRKFLEVEQRKLDLIAKAKTGKAAPKSVSLMDKLNNHMTAFEVDMADAERKRTEEEKQKDEENNKASQPEDIPEDPEAARKRIAEAARQKLVQEEAAKTALLEKEKLAAEAIERAEKQKLAQEEQLRERSKLDEVEQQNLKAWADEEQKRRLAQATQAQQQRQQQQQQPSHQQMPHPVQPQYHAQQQQHHQQQQQAWHASQQQQQQQQHQQQQAWMRQQQTQPHGSVPPAYHQQQSAVQRQHSGGQVPQYPAPSQHPGFHPTQQSYVAQQQPAHYRPATQPTHPGFRAVHSAPAESSQPQASPPQQSPTGINKKYTEMAEEDQLSANTALKKNILIHWALQPPAMQILRPIDQLLCNIQTVYPPAFGVTAHVYFKSWTPIPASDLMMGTALNDELLKKAVRKLRFFLHPDKLPRDLTEEHQFMCKLLWDVTNDAWEDYKKAKDQLDWMS